MTNRFTGMGLAVERPARIELLHPVTGLPLVNAEKQPAYVDVYHADSEVARRHERAAAQRRLDQGGAALTAVGAEGAMLDYLVALTAGWRLLDLNGNPLDVEFSPEAARELYASPATAWVREQVDRGAARRANFAPASSRS